MAITATVASTINYIEVKQYDSVEYQLTLHGDVGEEYIGYFREAGFFSRDHDDPSFKSEFSSRMLFMLFRGLMMQL
jgi:hypothetical protein